MKIRLVAARLFYAATRTDGRTDGQDMSKLIVPFRKFCEKRLRKFLINQTLILQTDFPNVISELVSAILSGSLKWTSDSLYTWGVQVLRYPNFRVLWRRSVWKLHSNTSPWVDRERTVSWPRACRYLTLIGPWSDSDRNYSTDQAVSLRSCTALCRVLV